MSSSENGGGAATGWYVVSQVKSDRVIYFTDDPDYRPPMEGDWYFVSHYLGAIPPAMTLRNCWGWRFNGLEFVNANDPDKESARQALVESNRQALHALLTNRIDAARRPWMPTCAFGESLRADKLREAAAYRSMAGGAAAPGQEQFELLEATAAARGITVAEAAELILQRARATREALLHSERVRESFAVAIDAARSDDEMIRLRSRLINDVGPGDSGSLPAPPVPMTPREWDEPLGDRERTHEAASLRTQLRDAINARRGRVHDGYLDDETLMKHKAKLAQSLLNNDGIRPEGMDFSLLVDFAEPRNLSLQEAARLSLGAVTEAEGILRATEREKDRALARIEAARTLRDFHRIRLELDSLNSRAS